jgi:uncharacterized SAM-binding protein YcdF (DUF218 family)
VSVRLDVDVTPVGGVPRPVRRRRRWPRRVALGLVLVVVGLAAYYLVTLYQVHTTGSDDQARPAEAIVVLGAAQYDGRPSAQLQARLDHALTLWQQGIAPLVVVTGGNQPGDRFTEAEASATYLAERGVPAEALVLESASRTTFDALASTQVLLAQRGLDDVVIVSDPFHLLRARLIATEVGLSAVTSPTPTSVVGSDEGRTRELKEAAGVAVGRIIGFERLVALTG